MVFKAHSPSASHQQRDWSWWIRSATVYGSFACLFSFANAWSCRSKQFWMMRLAASLVLGFSRSVIERTTPSLADDIHRCSIAVCMLCSDSATLQFNILLSLLITTFTFLPLWIKRLSPNFHHRYHTTLLLPSCMLELGIQLHASFSFMHPLSSWSSTQHPTTAPIAQNFLLAFHVFKYRLPVPYSLGCLLVGVVWGRLLGTNHIASIILCWQAVAIIVNGVLLQACQQCITRHSTRSTTHFAHKLSRQAHLMAQNSPDSQHPIAGRSPGDNSISPIHSKLRAEVKLNKNSSPYASQSARSTAISALVGWRSADMAPLEPGYRQWRMLQPGGGCLLSWGLITLFHSVIFTRFLLRLLYGTASMPREALPSVLIVTSIQVCRLSGPLVLMLGPKKWRVHSGLITFCCHDCLVALLIASWLLCPLPFAESFNWSVQVGFSIGDNMIQKMQVFMLWSAARMVMLQLLPPWQLLSGVASTVSLGACMWAADPQWYLYGEGSWGFPGICQALLCALIGIIVSAWFEAKRRSMYLQRYKGYGSQCGGCGTSALAGKGTSAAASIAIAGECEDTEEDDSCCKMVSEAALHPAKQRTVRTPLEVENGTDGTDAAAQLSAVLSTYQNRMQPLPSPPLLLQQTEQSIAPDSANVQHQQRADTPALLQEPATDGLKSAYAAVESVKAPTQPETINQEETAKAVPLLLNDMSALEPAVRAAACHDPQGLQDTRSLLCVQGGHAQSLGGHHDLSAPTTGSELRIGAKPSLAALAVRAAQMSKSPAELRTALMGLLGPGQANKPRPSARYKARTQYYTVSIKVDGVAGTPVKRLQKMAVSATSDAAGVAFSAAHYVLAPVTFPGCWRFVLTVASLEDEQAAIDFSGHHTLQDASQAGACVSIKSNEATRLVNQQLGVALTAHGSSLLQPVTFVQQSPVSVLPCPVALPAAAVQPADYETARALTLIISRQVLMGCMGCSDDRVRVVVSRSHGHEPVGDQTWTLDELQDLPVDQQGNIQLSVLGLHSGQHLKLEPHMLPLLVVSVLQQPRDHSSPDTLLACCPVPLLPPEQCAEMCNIFSAMVDESGDNPANVYHDACLPLVWDLSCALCPASITALVEAAGAEKYTNVAQELQLFLWSHSMLHCLEAATVCLSMALPALDCPETDPMVLHGLMLSDLQQAAIPQDMSGSQVGPNQLVLEPGVGDVPNQLMLAPGVGDVPNQLVLEPGVGDVPNQLVLEPGAGDEPNQLVLEPGVGDVPNQLVLEPGAGDGPAGRQVVCARHASQHTTCMFGFRPAGGGALTPYGKVVIDSQIDHTAVDRRADENGGYVRKMSYVTGGLRMLFAMPVLG